MTDLDVHSGNDMQSLDPDDLQWHELISENEAQRLQKALSAALGHSVFFSQSPEGPQSAPVRYQINTVTYLCGDLPQATLKEAATVVERVVYQAARYHLAAAMHFNVVRSDYEELQEKHRALQASEARYRALSEQLEERVQEQVRQIEDRQRRLYASERLNAVGQLAAGVAHEINNPIGFIRSNLNSSKAYVETLTTLVEAVRKDPKYDSLVEELDLPFIIEDFADLIRESADGADRIGRIVSGLKGFSGVDEQGPVSLSLKELLTSVGEVAAPLLKEGTVIDWQLSGELPPIRVDRAAMSQAFYSIIQNGVQACGDAGGSVTVKTMLEGQWQTVVIEDTGCGMEAETLERLFEPFYTTKPVGSGTGLGMTVSRDTIQGHNGTIDVDSTPGRGTCVTVRLPNRA